MDLLNKQLLVLVSSVLIIFLISLFLFSGYEKFHQAIPQASPPTSAPTPFKPFPYQPPKIPKSQSYRIMIVGDSMTAALGPNAQLLRQHLIEYYPENEFVNYNYGFGSTSIETLPDRLVNGTTYNGEYFPAILVQGFDLIIIESFAYNPLSQSTTGEGIEKHIKILDSSIKRVIDEKPEAVLAILTPIAPNKENFAKGVYDLSLEERLKWVNERVSYIKAIIDYAKENNIPLINVYEKTLTPDGNGDSKYINADDNIHPSAQGVDLISKTIASYIYFNEIFPE